MKAIELRESVLDYIKNKADCRFLRLVKAMATSYQDETTERISIKQYNKEIEASIAQIKQGKTYTHQQVGEHIKQWAKQ